MSTTTSLKRAGPLLAAACAALMLIPAASPAGGPPYPDATGDSSSAGDINGVTVLADKPSGQIVFRISGANLSTSPTSVTLLFVDADANPATGSPSWLGADYVFEVDDTSYDFEHYDGSNWVGTPYSTVHVSGGGASVTISVNRSEIGNTPEFNFFARSVNTDTKAIDDAPDVGAYNYAIAAGGPDIDSVVVTTTPSFGPKAGKRFVVTPSGLKLPSEGGMIVLPQPDTYSCKTTLRGKRLRGGGTGGCTVNVPKNARGKKLSVVLTVTYEGATRSFPFAFTVS